MTNNETSKEMPPLDLADDLIGELPWPKAGDRLITTGDADWYHCTTVGYGWDRWALYASGYKQAADIVVERIKGERRHVDFLVYPVMFLYRQYLELMVKNLIRKGWAVLQEADSDKLESHNLRKHWSIFRELVRRISPGASENEFDQIGKLVDEFCDHDPASFAFRYPTNKDSTPTLPQLQHVNLRNVQDVIGNAAGLLEACDLELDHRLDFLSEMRANVRRKISCSFSFITNQ